MSAAAPALYRIYDLPWTTGEVERERLRKILRASFGALLVLSIVMSFLPVPSPDIHESQEIPRRLARLVVERQAPPPPPPPPVVREEPIEPLPVVEPERVVEERAEPAPVVENEPPPPVDTTAQARERARGAGVLQFASQLSALRTNADVTANRLERTGTVGAGTEAIAVNERSLITSRAGTASGGINTASLSRNTGGGGLGGRATTVVESPVEGFGEAGGAAQRSGDSDKGSRSREEIERVFDANKGRIFTLYNRALRANPALQGKVVLRLTIAADGRVTHCEIVSSELNDPELERGLVQRVLQFQFEARDDIEAITTTKPIDFFPA
jgi:periplasmic protein TonB